MGLHSRRVWVSLLALGFPLDQAKELTQETWARLWAQHRQGRLEALELPGLAIVQARFVAIDVRRRARRALGEQASGDEDVHPSAEARLAAAQTLAEVLRELDTLPDAHRRAFELAQEGRAHADIAQLLGFTPRRVRQLIWEIRSRLRARFPGAP